MNEGLRLGLIGAGQLGGSFALALKASGAVVHITAYDPDTAQAQTLQQRGGADAVATSAQDAAREADIVMLAAPLRSYRSIASAIAPVLKPHAIVTDLGSVKGSMAGLAGTLPARLLVPGHPIAGSEKSGAQIAREDLFQKKLMILTPLPENEPETLSIVTELWSAVGADVIHMPVEVHDAIYAHVSHLPHFIAFVAAELLYSLGVQVTPQQDVLQKFLRISRSNARMWTDVALENREALLPALATYIALLDHFVSELRASPETGEDMQAAEAAARYLPRILASSLISTVSFYGERAGLELRPFGAGGMRDIVAPAASAPEEDMEAISKVAPVVAGVIEQAIALLRSLEALIGSDDADGLYAHISAMVAHARALVTPRQ